MRLDKLLTAAGLTRAQAKRAVAEGRARVGGEGSARRGAARGRRRGAARRKAGDRAGRGLLDAQQARRGVDRRARRAGKRRPFALLPEDVRRREPSPIGRLDKDVTGLLLFTTHGEHLHRLISPRYAVEKVYIARVEGTPDALDAKKLAAGIAFSDFTARPRAAGGA